MAQEYALHYLGTKDGQEVDFAIVCDQRIEQMIEVKLSDSTFSKSLLSFYKKYDYPAIQLVKSPRIDHIFQGIQILDADRYLRDFISLGI